MKNNILYGQVSFSDFLGEETDFNKVKAEALSILQDFEAVHLSNLSLAQQRRPSGVLENFLKTCRPESAKKVITKSFSNYIFFIAEKDGFEIILMTGDNGPGEAFLTFLIRVKQGSLFTKTNDLSTRAVPYDFKCDYNPTDDYLQFNKAEHVSFMRDIASQPIFDFVATLV